MRNIVLLLFMVFSLLCTAQEKINQIDENGLRQGLWEKYYENGKLMYEGYFQNGKPVGEWKRYHDNAKIQAIINYTEISDSAKTELYDTSGQKIAEGIYLNEKKSGNWKYFVLNKLSSETNYMNGKKQGVSRKYYKSGELLEETNWDNDSQEGTYKAFFKSGNPYMICQYSGNQRNGFCKTYYPNGDLEMNASYKNDQRHGEWTFLNQRGEVLYILNYNEGKLLNPEVLDSIQTNRINEMEQNKDVIPDPEKFMQNPDEFLNRNGMPR